MRCIYRASKAAGVACELACVHNTNFCASHRRFFNMKLYSDIHVIIGEEQHLRSDNLYECIVRYWRSQPVATQCNVDIAFQTIDILSYLLNHESLSRISAELKLNGLAKAKKATLNVLISVMWKVWCMSKSKTAMTALSVAQRNWRQKRMAIMGPRPDPSFDSSRINDADPFTMEAISSLPPTRVFTYTDPMDVSRIYAFDVHALHDSVYNFNQMTNPFTKVAYPPDMLRRLGAWRTRTARHLPSAYAKPERTTWQTSMQAFTELASILEETHGIYLQPSWFMHFDQDNIMSVFRMFRNLVGSTPFMNPQEEVRAYVTRVVEESHYALVRETIKLLKADGNTFQTCTVIVCLAHHSYDFSKSLPEWVYDGAHV